MIQIGKNLWATTVPSGYEKFKISGTNYLCGQEDGQWQAIPPRLDNSYKIVGAIDNTLSFDFNCESYVEFLGEDPMNALAYLWGFNNRGFFSANDAFLEMLKSRDIYPNQLDGENVLILEKISVKVEPKYSSPQQSKLLKERGFNVRVLGYSFLSEEKIRVDLGFLNHNKEVDGYLSKISRPEQWQVVDWLYIVHKLWILPIPTATGHFAYKIIDLQLDPENEIERPPFSDVSAMDYNTPYEAISDGIDYILKEIL